MRPNPPWADKALYANWLTISKFAEETGLPLPDPELLPTRQVSWKEFGCGFWGCVYPTSDPGIVCKLTADETEAQVAFALEDLAESKNMDGIVRYFGVLPVKGKKRTDKLKGVSDGKPKHVTLIWRESASCGATLSEQAKKGRGDKAKRQGYSWQLLYNALVAADCAKEIHNKSKDPSRLVQQAEEFIPSARALAKRYEEELVILAGHDYHNHETRIQSSRGPEGFAYCIAAFELLCKHLVKIGIVDKVAKTMLELLHRGILLYDVHEQNICELQRRGGPSWVITDPGGALFLGSRPKYSDVVRPKGTPR